ncbi:MAG: exonuclease domain-containing protein [Phycisphaerales bacterium]|nr:exonuclease domain-containing protein [Phycisphaerales bacterium]
MDQADPTIRVTIIDTETTGISRDDEVIEVGLVQLEVSSSSGQVLNISEQYSGLREPNCPMHPAAAQTHGISLTELRGKQLDENRIVTLIEASEVLIAHNAGFDRSMLKRTLPQAAHGRWLCSVRGIKWRAKGFASARLDHLLGVHRISRARSHRALDDALALGTLLSHHDQVTGRPYMSELLASTPLRGQSKPRSKTPMAGSPMLIELKRRLKAEASTPSQ